MKITDKMRLDFLTKYQVKVVLRQKTPYHSNPGEVIIQGPGWGTANWLIVGNQKGITQSGSSPRAAIDEAMKYSGALDKERP